MLQSGMVLGAEGSFRRVILARPRPEPVGMAELVA